MGLGVLGEQGEAGGDQVLAVIGIEFQGSSLGRGPG